MTATMSRHTPPLILPWFQLLLLLVDNKGTTMTVAAECHTYLAPSTIPGAGLGVFAGSKSYKTGDRVTLPDVVIPVIELDWHNNYTKYEFLWKDYVWSGSNFHDMELDSEDGFEALSAASGGMGAATNCHISLHNVHDTKIQMDQGDVPMDSPGLGAFTPYHGRAFHAITEIPAGMELFSDYGYGYFLARTRTYGPIPFEDDYVQADELLKNFLELESSLQIEQAVVEDLYDAMIQLKGEIFSRTLSALPSNRTQIEPVMHQGGTDMQDFNRSIRSMEWLEQHGQCMDNIKPQKSTLPHAGRGAFANRFIAAGTLVAPAPLIHIPDGSILNMYYPLHDENFEKAHFDEKARDKIQRDPNNPKHHQLLVNYCFAHHESTLLMCPYGILTALINHHQEKANTKIVWSANNRNPEWRETPIEVWGSQPQSGLSFDYVATRDIEEDEEIFIDYGDAWEAAWQDHVADYYVDGQPPRPHFMQAADRNTRMDIPIRLVTDRPYDLDDVRVTVIGHYVEFNGAQGFDTNEDYDCDVLHHNKDRDTYMVQLTYPLTNEEQCVIDVWDKGGHILFELPRQAFFFYDVQACTRDHVQLWSFRHPMMIPDEMLPDIWRNRVP